MTPLWLDPTPAVRQFISGFANAPVREPFVSQRKQLRLGVLIKQAAKKNGAGK